MAVFTEVSESDAKAFLAKYPIPEVTSVEPIEAGSENTNYLVTTAEEKYVLTLFEDRVKRADIPHLLNLHSFLGEKNFLCPEIVESKDGGMSLDLNHKKAILQSFVEGEKRLTPTPEECLASGRMLASLHRTTKGYEAPLTNRMNETEVSSIHNTIEAFDTEGKYKNLLYAISKELAYQDAMFPEDFPSGACHLDWFPDNVFFSEGTHAITGAIDFWFAGKEAFVYDLAIALNAWGFDDEGHILPLHFAAFLEGYHGIRPLSTMEIKGLPNQMRRAALRFYATRLHDTLMSEKPESIMAGKPYQSWLNRLEYHQHREDLKEYGQR